MLSKSIKINKSLKLKNRNNVYKNLYFSKKSKTKKEIELELGISLPTISQNLQSLCKLGLVKEDYSEEFTGGRKSCVYQIVDNKYYSVGISLTDVYIRLLITDLRLNQLAYKKIKYTCKEFENISKFICDELFIFLNENNIEQYKIMGVGIAIPGLLDYKNKIIITAPTLGFKNISYKVIEEIIPFNVYVENDATAGGIAEFNRIKKTNLAYILWENGIGGAIIINNNIYGGDDIKAAEFGHICVVPNGRECRCGKKGCLEEYIRSSRFNVDLGITTEDFFEEIKNGNKEYYKMFDESLQYLAMTIRNIKQILDCDIILGGHVTAHIKPYFNILENYVYSDNDKHKYLYLSEYGDKVVAKGMALYFIQKFIKNI